MHIFQQILLEDEFRDTCDVGIVIQCYLRDSADDLRKLRDWAGAAAGRSGCGWSRGPIGTTKPCSAQATGWPVPVFQQQMGNRRQLRTAHAVPACGIASICGRRWAATTCDRWPTAWPWRGTWACRQSGFELQMLYGMADAEKQVLVDLGYRMRIYMPYGELIPGMAYLVRRLLENTSNDSFLRASFAEHVSVEKLLMNPLRSSPASHRRPAERASRRSTPKFAPRVSQRAADRFWPRAEPPRDAGRPWTRSQRQSERDYPLVIDGSGRGDEPTGSASINPSHKARVGWPGRRGGSRARGRPPSRRRGERLPAGASLDVERSGPNSCARGRDACASAASNWPPGKSTNAARPWREADADVCEAIDFCEYYAAGADRAASTARRRRARRGKSLRIPAARRGGRDRALEFSAGDPDRHDHGRAGDRQHGRHEAGRAIVGHGRQADGDLSRARTCRRACSTICPARARRSGRRWSSIRTWR